MKLCAFHFISITCWADLEASQDLVVLVSLSSRVLFESWQYMNPFPFKYLKGVVYSNETFCLLWRNYDRIGLLWIVCSNWIHMETKKKTMFYWAALLSWQRDWIGSEWNYCETWWLEPPGKEVKKKEMKHDSHLHRTKPRVVRGGREEAKVVPRSDGQFGGRHAVKVGQNHQDPFEDQRLLTLATSQRENLRRENNPLGQLETNSPTSFSKLKVMSCISDSFIRLSMVVFLDCWGFHTCLILFFN